MPCGFMSVHQTREEYVKTYMKKLIMALLSLVSLTSAVNAQCDFSKVKLAYGNSCNVYKFEIAGTVDTCFKTTTYIYNYKTSKITDTFYSRTFTKVFSDTGKYKVYTKVLDKCHKCDTSFYQVLNVTCKPHQTTKCDWSKVGLYYSNKCGHIVFELGSKDTCISKYTLWAYRHKTGKLDTLAHDRVFTRTLDTGWYTFKASFYNKCCNSDTFIYKEVYIGCESVDVKNYGELVQSNSIKIVPNPFSKGFIFTFNGSQSEYVIYIANGQIVEMGIINGEKYVNTEYWKNGTYIIRVGNEEQIILLRR